MTELAQYLKSSPPASGFDEVYYPGELEHLRARRLLRDGITVEPATWERLRELADKYGLGEELQL